MSDAGQRRGTRRFWVPLMTRGGDGRIYEKTRARAGVRHDNAVRQRSAFGHEAEGMTQHRPPHAVTRRKIPPRLRAAAARRR